MRPSLRSKALMNARQADYVQLSWFKLETEKVLLCFNSSYIRGIKSSPSYFKAASKSAIALSEAANPFKDCLDTPELVGT